MPPCTRTQLGNHGHRVLKTGRKEPLFQDRLLQLIDRIQKPASIPGSPEIIADGFLHDYLTNMFQKPKLKTPESHYFVRV
jgi:hypothetical protein